jgi:hypothetical protein
MTPEDTPSALTCPHCGYAGAQAGLRYCPNCGEPLPQAGVRTTQITIDQQVGQVQGGEVTGVKIGQVVGNVFVGSDDEAQARQRRNLRILLEKVRSFWVDGVLAAAASGATLIELQKRVEPEAVEHPLAQTADSALPASPALPPGIRIAEAFDAMDQALLIMDGTGSGKTTALLELARDAVGRAEHDPTKPIPVVLNLSSWAQLQQPIVDWVAAELALRYQIPREMGRRWLDEQRLALLLDGLDEVGPEHIGACIAALNRFREDHGLLPIGICTRTEDYQAAAAPLRLSGAIELLPLTDAQIEAYLAATGPHAATLAALLQQDSDLQDAVRTPLMLNLMRQAFADVSPEELQAERFRIPRERRQRLLERYVDRLTAPVNAAPRPLFTPGQTQNGLSWLARGMTAQRQSIFLVEQLQPAWLATRGGYWAYWVGSRAVVGLLIGLLQAITAHVVGTVQGRAIYVVTALLAGVLVGVIDGVGARMSPTLMKWPVWFLQASSALIAALVAGACFYLAFGPGLGLPEQDAWRLAAGMALVYGLVFGLGGVRTGEAGDVRPVESLAWSWRAAGRGLFPALLMLLAVVGVIAAIFAGSNPLQIWLTFGLVYGAGAGLALVMIYGLSGRTVEHRSYPNQGTWLSARNAARAGLLLGVAAGLGYGVIYGALPGLVVALRIGVLAALWYGLFDVIKHLTLRGLLAGSRQAPWNLVRFLDYADRLGLMQKVGGGYMFMNRLVQEYFAMAEGEEQRMTK